MEATRELKLHANSLAVNAATLTLETGETVKDVKLVLDQKWETLSVQLPAEVGFDLVRAV